jgi:hypothetical protein
MYFKTEIDTDDYAPQIYKIKRLAKIWAVCAGIIVVFVSLGMIVYLFVAEFIIKHHGDPTLLGIYIGIVTVGLILLSVGQFFVGLWESEDRILDEYARRLNDAK